MGAAVVQAGEEKRVMMPASVGPRTLMRAPALYEYNKELYTERISPLEDDLTDRVMNQFFSDKPQEFLGVDNSVVEEQK